MLPEDIEFVSHYTPGIEHVMSNTCGFDAKVDKKIFAEAIKIDEIIRRSAT